MRNIKLVIVVPANNVGLVHQAVVQDVAALQDVVVFLVGESFVDSASSLDYFLFELLMVAPGGRRLDDFLRFGPDLLLGLKHLLFEKGLLVMRL